MCTIFVQTSKEVLRFTVTALIPVARIFFVYKAQSEKYTMSDV